MAPLFILVLKGRRPLGADGVGVPVDLGVVVELAALQWAGQRRMILLGASTPAGTQGTLRCWNLGFPPDCAQRLEPLLCPERLPQPPASRLPRLLCGLAPLAGSGPGSRRF